MPTRQYKGPKQVPRVDGSEPINGWVRTIAENQTYPAVRRRNKLALDADPVRLHFYQRLASGRRCTCWGKDNSPSTNCLTCFGQGIVGGFLKYGTHQVVVDPSLPELTTVGIDTDKASQGPAMWVLSSDALDGVLETVVEFEGHWGAVDGLHIVSYEPDGGSVAWHIKLYGASDSTYVQLTSSNVERLFDRPQLYKLRCVLRRPGLEARSPVATNALIRVKRTPTSETIVKADRPKITKALALAESGLLDEWTTAQHWLDDTLPRITSGDWFYNIDELIRWKVVDATALEPQDYLLSWDCTCRRVQKFEPYARYPV